MESNPFHPLMMMEDMDDDTDDVDLQGWESPPSVHSSNYSHSSYSSQSHRSARCKTRTPEKLRHASTDCPVSLLEAATTIGFKEQPSTMTLSNIFRAVGRSIDDTKRELQAHHKAPPDNPSAPAASTTDSLTVQNNIDTNPSTPPTTEGQPLASASPPASSTNNLTTLAPNDSHPLPLPSPTTFSTYHAQLTFGHKKMATVNVAEYFRRWVYSSSTSFPNFSVLPFENDKGTQITDANKLPTDNQAFYAS